MSDGVSANPATLPASARRKRPVFLNLAAIRFPVGAVASIGHRVSGVLLLIALPALAAALGRSLRSAADFAAMFGGERPLWLTGVLIVLVWAAAHHLVAGVRHLLMDLGIGSGLPPTRASAWAALLVGLLAAAAFAARQWA